MLTLMAPAQSGVELGMIGRYRLQSLLGEGGFGRVFLAWDDELQRLVAIKIPRVDVFRSTLQVESFLNEAQLAAGLQHPGIVTVFDIGRQTDGLFFIVLEFIDGQSLTARLVARRLSHIEATRLILSVAEAVHYAHRKGLIHRDLKPDNILLDREGNPHVADFGLAIRAEHLHLHVREVAGTAAYMAPEQVRAETHRLDARTDLWALGVIYYFMLSGRRPFTGNPSETLRGVLNLDPKPPRAIDPTVPRELERICLRCLGKWMSDRFSSVAEFADDLRAWLALQEANNVVVPDGTGLGSARRPGTESPGDPSHS